MTTSVKIKETYEVESKLGAFYTGGNVEWHEDKIFCQTATHVNLVDVNSGAVTARIGLVNEDSEAEIDAIHTFTSHGSTIVTSHNSGLLRLWSMDGEMTKMWKYIHIGPIAKLNLKDSVLASGGADGVVRVWDLEHHVCILGLRNCSGVVNLVEFSPDLNSIYASGDDGKIVSHSLPKGEVKQIYSGHYSKVTSLSFHHDEKYFVSGGRDKVLMMWEIGNATALKTIPLYEEIESVIAMPEKFILGDFQSGSGVYVATGGSNGIVRVWDAKNAKEVYVQSNSLVSKSKEEGGLAITKLVPSSDIKSIGVVSAEQNIILHNLETFEVAKQMIGFSDEILDIIFCGQNDSHLAVATNSNDIKIYETSSMNCNILKGHTDIVLALGKAQFNVNYIVSSSKDNTLRLWDISTLKCLAVGHGHTASVGSVSFANSNQFIVSASQDTCLKIWTIDEKNLVCEKTQQAHAKDINGVCVSPNDKLIASCSQDKMVKLWTENLTALGTLKGHRRGVWSVRFSPIDQVLMSSSADCTIKLWSITDLNCIKTIEGHEASVVRADFLSCGLQIISAGADGLLKLFDVKSGECTSTFDEHEARIWALAVDKSEGNLVSGGADSTLIRWKDVTEIKKLERIQEAEQLSLEEQKLQNYIHENNLIKALKLALKLGKPYQVLKIIQGVLKQNDNALTDAIKELRNDHKESLLKCCMDWNTNSRNCQAAQLVLNILINEVQSGEFRPVGLSGSIESALPYTERHFKRVTQMVQDFHFIDYTINCMLPHSKVNK
ncbi:PREDICTED: transducin beta-like protein 3 [Nicrophorus vespilloides]|uniref:Transducin beta-like protein 3 n=1 Tax=Nicrophorus vespilloides TaxID=110193 RepID=A0ABM1NJ89_NICVS|nr:PREDICTED: transducin beta-like protein 3 [Nicrophorus vespilloides]